MSSLVSLVNTETLAKLLNGEFNESSPVLFTFEGSFELLNFIGFDSQKLLRSAIKSTTELEILSSILKSEECNEFFIRDLFFHFVHAKQFFTRKIFTNDGIAPNMIGKPFYQQWCDYLNKKEIFKNCRIDIYGTIHNEENVKIQFSESEWDIKRMNSTIFEVAIYYKNNTIKNRIAELMIQSLRQLGNNSQINGNDSEIKRDNSQIKRDYSSAVKDVLKKAFNDIDSTNVI